MSKKAPAKKMPMKPMKKKGLLVPIAFYGRQ
jgi:hypothetical protein